MSLYEGRDIAFKGVIWQYMSSIVSLLAGLFFYIFIENVKSSLIEGDSDDASMTSSAGPPLS